MCLFKRGKKGITILGINVTIPSLEIAINQSLFKFTQKGSYIANTLVFPNMSMSISIQCEANRGFGGGDSSVVRAPDSWLKGRGFESLLERRENFPCWNGGRIFFSRVDFLCWLLFRYPFHPRVTTVACKKSLSFCQKCRWQVTAKHAYTLRIEPCFGIGHNLSLMCQMTSEDIKHQLNNNNSKQRRPSCFCCYSAYYKAFCTISRVFGLFAFLEYSTNI